MLLPRTLQNVRGRRVEDRRDYVGLDFTLYEFASKIFALGLDSNICNKFDCYSSDVVPLCPSGTHSIS